MGASDAALAGTRRGAQCGRTWVNTVFLQLGSSAGLARCSRARCRLMHSLGGTLGGVVSED